MKHSHADFPLLTAACGNHKVASLARGGLRPPITFISPERGACCSIFPGMQDDALIFYPENISSAKLISSKAPGMSHLKRLFINDEI